MVYNRVSIGIHWESSMLLWSTTEHENGQAESPLGRGKGREALGWVVE